MKNYKKGFIDLVAVAFIGIALLVASGVAFYKESSLSKKTEPSFGSFSPTAGGTYRLQSSIGTSNTSITLSSFKEPTSGIKYTMSYLNSSIMYGTIDPQTTYKEFISFTGITQNADGTATLTGVSRGLGFSYPYTASSTLAQSHSGQSIFILSNAPQLYNQYSAKGNDETITGLWTFTQTPIGINPGGQPNATESILGVSQLATQIQMASSTALGSSGGSVVLQAKYATSSPYNSGLYVPITRNDGKLNPNFIATTSSDTYNFGGSVNLTNQTNIIASSTQYTLNVGNINATSTITVNGSSVPLAATSTTYTATTTTHTWTKPLTAKKVLVEIWGAGGGSGGITSTIAVLHSSGAGGGGAYNYKWFDASELSSTVTITIGVGGIPGTISPSAGGVGGTTTFGSYLSAYGGGGGGADSMSGSCGSDSGGSHGAGGGTTSAGGSGSTGGCSGNPAGSTGGGFMPGVSAAGATNQAGSWNNSIWGGGAGGGQGTNAFQGSGSSIYGGGGGTANSVYGGAGGGGTSTYGGNGGASGQPGQQPGGGAGQVSNSTTTATPGQAGGDGQARVTVFY